MFTLEDGSQVKDIPDNYTGRIITKFGSIEWEAWYYRGKHHRIGGPACQWEDITKNWFINNKQITKQTKLVILQLI
jgi:hypothetical protein